MRRQLLLGIATLATLTPAAAGAAPSQLYGKSIIVSWTEVREQRLLGESNFRQQAFAGALTVYVSSKGTLFNRRTNTNPAGASGHVDQVGNDGRTTIGFQGRTLVAVRATNGGARRIVVTFDGAFTSCTANVIRGKQTGAATIRTQSIIHSGLEVEIRSVQTSGETCTIKDGNVFAGQ